jgi:hypothetical protein
MDSSSATSLRSPGLGSRRLRSGAASGLLALCVGAGCLAEDQEYDQPAVEVSAEALSSDGEAGDQVFVGSIDELGEVAAKQLTEDASSRGLMSWNDVFSIQPIGSSASYRMKARICNILGVPISETHGRVAYLIVNETDGTLSTGALPGPWEEGECKDTSWFDIVAIGARGSCSGMAPVQVMGKVAQVNPVRWGRIEVGFQGSICTRANHVCQPCSWDTRCLWRPGCTPYPP